MDYALTGITLPITLRTAEPLSDEEFMRFSRENKILPMERDAQGNIIIMSPTGNEGAERNAEIIFELVLWNRQYGHGTVTDSNGGFRLPDTSVRAPDASWTSSARMAELTHKQREGFAPIVPEFIIELRSQSDRLTALDAKMRNWIDYGVELGWLIDPFARSVTIYRPGQEAECLDNISQVAGEDPIAGFVLPLDRIFASQAP